MSNNSTEPSLATSRKPNSKKICNDCGNPRTLVMFRRAGQAIYYCGKCARKRGII